MKNFRNSYKKNRFRNNNDRQFRRNGSNPKFSTNYSDQLDFRKLRTFKNGNSNKLVEKYNELAKEALSNGDKIMSENYLQHADHFTRISEQQNSQKVEKKISEISNDSNQETESTN
tara:strand:- start:324 stop:671 length:348 start_codon:yes stop_codon:yes gene_type:complete